MMRPPIRRVVAGAASLLLLGVSTAAITPPTVKFTDSTLKNGIRVLISEDHVAPVVSVAIVYNVGSRDERKGRTGFAHLFEHMMFKGSQNVGPGEHFYSIPATALERVRHHFESIPSQPAPPAVDIAEPPQQADRRAVVDDQLARLPRVDIAYHVPSSSSPDDDAISVLGTVLSGGRSSRLYESLVRVKQVAVNASAFAPAMRGPRLFYVSGSAAAGRSIDDVEAALLAEVERIKTEPIEGWEMEKARNASRRGFVSRLGSSLSRAVALLEYALLYGDPGRLNTRYQRIAAVTAADVQRVAKQYLTPSNRTVVVTRPQAPAQRSGGF